MKLKVHWFRNSSNWYIFQWCFTISAISAGVLSDEVLNILVVLLPSKLAIFNVRLEIELRDKLSFWFSEYKYWIYSRILLLNCILIWRYDGAATKYLWTIWTKFRNFFHKDKIVLNLPFCFGAFFNQLSGFRRVTTGGMPFFKIERKVSWFREKCPN